MLRRAEIMVHRYSAATTSAIAPVRGPGRPAGHPNSPTGAGVFGSG